MTRYVVRVVAVALVAWAAMPATTALAAKRCAGKKATIVGTKDRDVLRGRARNDVITGLGKADRLFGKGGDDRLCGGGGSDRLGGSVGNDVLVGAGGSDFIAGGAGDDSVRGGGRDDYLDGGDGNDQVRGAAGDDFLIGRLGDDLLDGGAGTFDVVSFHLSPAGVTVDLDVATPQATGEGTDTLLALEGAVGSSLDDTVRGQDMAVPTGNGLFGGPGDDLLDGRGGDDFLGGDEGDDELFGRTGDDFLDGGASTTGPPKGDVGNGGAHVAGDVCISLEDSATTGCESFPARSASRRTAAAWPEVVRS